MRSFTHHWTLVNASLAPAALTLAGNYTLANFISDYNAIIAALSQVSLAEQQEEVLKTPRENAKKSGSRSIAAVSGCGDWQISRHKISRAAAETA